MVLLFINRVTRGYVVISDFESLFQHVLCIIRNLVLCTNCVDWSPSFTCRKKTMSFLETSLAIDLSQNVANKMKITRFRSGATR